MASKTPEPEVEQDSRPEYSDNDKSRARQWFTKAEDLRSRQNYDYAIESYVTGLGFWPDGVEEACLPLWSLAIQRQQSGGKKPGMMESMKKPTSGKDVKQAMLNALLLLAKDPTSATYADALLKNAVKGDFLEMVKWAAERGMESLRRDKKPNVGRFKTYRENLMRAGERAIAWQLSALSVTCFERAVESVDYLVSRSPGDMALKNLQRDMSGKLTIARGKYGNADSFRDSLQDGDSQRLLHDAERIKQGDEGLESLLAGLRKQYEENPELAKHVNAYTDVLLKTEQPKYEQVAIEVLESVAERLSNYNFKQRADDVRLRQLARRSSKLKLKAQETGAEDDKLQYRLARQDELESAVVVFRERTRNYPTDLRIKAKLGESLFRTQRYDEAIPILQEAQSDPRSRVKCQLMIGQAFQATGNPQQAVEVLQDALAHYDREDAVSRALLYNLGQSCEASGQIDEAKAAYGRLLRVDYNYADGDARKRLSAL
jgi:predicted Zn-dependent protease